MPLAGTKDRTGKLDIPLMIGDEEHGPVTGGPVVESGSICHQRTRHISGDQKPKISLNQMISRGGQITCIETGRQFPEPASFEFPQDRGVHEGVRHEHLMRW